MSETWAEAMNVRNAAIWDRRSEEMHRRLNVPYLAEQASKLLNEQLRGGKPVKECHSLEGALQAVERNAPLFRVESGHWLPVQTGNVEQVITREARSNDAGPSHYSSLKLEAAMSMQAKDRGRRGGQAKTADDLTKAIRAILEFDPGLPQRRIVHQLLRKVGDFCQFTQHGDSITWIGEDGRTRRVAIKALKDRISRVRKSGRGAEPRLPPD